MKRILMLSIILCATTAGVFSQTPTPAPAGQKTLAATMSVFVFPTKGQAMDIQSRDEMDCYTWAVQNVGTDPFELSKQSEAQIQKTEQSKQQAAQTGKGAGAGGAVRGAAMGALIGEIANDDAGEGAAYGAAAGMLRGRRRARAAKSQAVEAAEEKGQQAQAVTTEQLANFKKAFSVCLEAKDYMVKF